MNELCIQNLAHDWLEINDAIINNFPVICQFTLLQPSEDAGINLITKLCEKLIVTNLHRLKRYAVLVDG